MKRVVFFLLLSVFAVLAKSQDIKLQKLAFCTPQYDEFAPQAIDGGIIFVSNKKSAVLNTFVETNPSGEEKYLSHLYKAEFKERDSLHYSISSFSFNSSSLPGGPATANNTCDHIIFTRQLKPNKNKPQLVLFETHLIDGIWSDPIQLEFTKDKFNYAQPFLSKDSKRLYFVSDRKNGYGGLDIWLSELYDGTWQEPINLGQGINSNTNEIFPYEYSKGVLYFSSNRNESYNIFISGSESKPNQLPEPINSTYDDFSFITKDGVEGLLSSNRDGTDDIFIVQREVQEFTNCIESSYVGMCYKFVDLNPNLEGTAYDYKWYFGDGETGMGDSTRHCYSKEGIYQVKMNLVDTLAGEEIEDVSSFELEIKKRYPYFINYKNPSEKEISINICDAEKQEQTSNQSVWSLNGFIYHDLPNLKIAEDDLIPGYQSVKTRVFHGDTICYSKTIFSSNSLKPIQKIRIKAPSNHDVVLDDNLIQLLFKAEVDNTEKSISIHHSMEIDQNEMNWLKEFETAFKNYFKREIQIMEDSTYTETILCID